MFSVPCLLNYDGPPEHGPIGPWNIDHPLPMAGIKPILMRAPTPFKGEHDDIDRFLGDCQMYFEAFKQHFMGIHSLMVVFTASHLKGATQDWWIHLHEEYWYVPADNNNNNNEGGPRYRYSNWNEFVETFCKQFCDPAIEEVHEKRMGELRMGSDPAHIYFQRLEREAKLANRWVDESDRGALVQAIRQGVPTGYTTIIANISVGVSHTYSEWKDQILRMYEERQKKMVYDQTHRTDQRGDKKNFKQITATSSNKNTTGGATSSSTSKLTGDGKGCNSGGRWIPTKRMTYGGAGEPMQIDQAKKMKEERCFLYDMDTKIEEVKE